MNRYRLGKKLGDGSFSTVFEATSEQGALVAVKQMKQRYVVWDDCVNLREVRALRHLSHPNVVKLREVIREGDTLFLVMEHCSSTLLSILQARGEEHPFDETEMRLVMYQLLAGIDCCHQAGFMHRDVKPENLLCNTLENVKLADFGLARPVQKDRRRGDLTRYISTRWYRAPELLLSFPEYGKEVDLWAAGAIMAELMLGRPMFNGTTDTDQLFQQCAMLGSPTSAEWPAGHVQAAALEVNLPQVQGTPLSSLFGGRYSEECLRLLRDLLTFDPAQRPSAGEALRHAFFDL